MRLISAAPAIPRIPTRAESNNSKSLSAIWHALPFGLDGTTYLPSSLPLMHPSLAGGPLFRFRHHLRSMLRRRVKRAL
jgi:hypothetical protein